MRVEVPPDLEEYLFEKNSREVSVQDMISQLDDQFHGHLRSRKLTSLKSHQPMYETLNQKMWRGHQNDWIIVL